MSQQPDALLIQAACAVVAIVTLSALLETYVPVPYGSRAADMLFGGMVGWILGRGLL